MKMTEKVMMKDTGKIYNNIGVKVVVGGICVLIASTSLFTLINSVNNMTNNNNSNITSSVVEAEVNLVSDPTTDTTIEAAPSSVDLSAYNIAYAVDGAESYTGSISVLTDLKCRINISEKEFASLIEYWTSKYPNSLFKGSEAAFIHASQITGLDPIFLLALAGQESGWDVDSVSYKINGNPYSIGASCDYGYYSIDYIFGDSFEEGIINGAIWINNKFYNGAEEHCLCDMAYGDHRYAEDPNWMANISVIMDESYKQLLLIKKESEKNDANYAF